MKKLLVLLFLTISVFIYGQNVNPLHEYYEAFDMSTITGTDTVLFYTTDTYRLQQFKAFGSRIGVEIEYKGLDANDATFDIGVSMGGQTFNSFGTSYSLPFTMNTADSAQVNGSKPTSASAYKASKSWNIVSTPFSWIAVKIIKSSVTSGTLYIWIKQLRQE